MNKATVSTKPRDRRIQAYGETGLLVQFDGTEAVAASDAVTTLNHQLLALNLRGIESTTPSYISLLIIFDPSVIARNRLASILTDLLECTGAHLADESSALRNTAWCLPTLLLVSAMRMRSLCRMSSVCLGIESSRPFARSLTELVPWGFSPASPIWAVYPQSSIAADLQRQEYAYPPLQ